MPKVGKKSFAYTQKGKKAAKKHAKKTGKKVRSGYCLLYTSPSPRDRTSSRMPSSA